MFDAGGWDRAHWKLEFSHTVLIQMNLLKHQNPAAFNKKNEFERKLKA